MIIDDFNKIEFTFENLESITFDRKDIGQIRINDNFIQIGKSLFRKITVSIRNDAEAIEWWPECNQSKENENNFYNYSKNPLYRFEKYKGCGDITEVIIYQDGNIKRRISSHWSDTDNAYNGWNVFNLYQHEGFETDEDMNLTGNYVVSFYSPIRKTYEFLQDDDFGFVLFTLSTKETGLDYKLSFICDGSPDRFNVLSGCLLADTGDQYLPIEFECDELPIRNIWMDETKPIDEEKIDRVRKYIQKNKKTIMDHHHGLIDDLELAERLEKL